MSYFDVLPPNVTMRVSDYIFDIINFIHNVFEKGYAYELNKSVYFDIVKFRKEHPYESLEFYQIDNTAMSDEEQEIPASAYTNANASDFIIWITSKSHQPLWSSPSRTGRPRSMLRCDLICNIILGRYSFCRSVRSQKFVFFLDSQCDIHTGENHSFPCYDNLITQCTNNDTHES